MRNPAKTSPPLLATSFLCSLPSRFLTVITPVVVPMFSVKREDADTGNTLLVRGHTALLRCPSTPPPAGSLLSIKTELNPSPSSIPVPRFKRRRGGELVASYTFQAPPLVQASGVKTEPDNVAPGECIESNGFLERANPCARQLRRPRHGRHKQH